MLLTTLGLILLFAPILAAPVFGIGRKGLLALAAFLFAWHVALPTALQSLGAFSYAAVLTANSLAVAALLLLARRRGCFGWPKISFSWFTASVFALALAFLLSLHFRYTGPVDTVFGIRSVSADSSPYPFYSDEWVAIILANQSIESGGLPVTNPLEDGKPFANFLTGFHATVAGVLSLLSLEPLSGYVWLAVANGLAVTALIFLVLRRLGAGSASASVAAFSALMITNGGNLPGLWNLLPYSLSLTALLLGLALSLERSSVASAVSFATALAVYPPTIIFLLPVVAGLAIGAPRAARRALLRVFVGSALLATLAVFAFSGEGLAGTLRTVASLVVRPSLDPGHVRYLPWHVLPLFTVPFVFLGAYEVFRRRVWAIATPFAVTAVAWVAYPLIAGTVVVVEPSRVAAVGAIFAVAVAGFGFNRAWRTVATHTDVTRDRWAVTACKFVVIGFLFSLGWFSSFLGQWHKNTLVTEDPNGRRAFFTPSPPITRYLTRDDIHIFADARGKRLVAPAWKGLVLAASSGVLPLESKRSTISVQRLAFSNFFGSTCEEKSRLALKYKVDMVYAPPFSCPGFIEIGRSAEGLVAYEFLHR